MLKKKLMKTINNIHVGSRTYLLPESVIMIQAEINYSLIYLLDGKKVIVSTCLKKLENRFAIIHSFARVHKSFLINLDYLKSYQAGYFLLENDLTCSVSRRKFKRLIASQKVSI